MILCAHSLHLSQTQACKNQLTPQAPNRNCESRPLGIRRYPILIFQKRGNGSISGVNPEAFYLWKFLQIAAGILGGGSQPGWEARARAADSLPPKEALAP